MIEMHARDHGITRLYTEASDLARPAFERAGYSVTHKREFAIAHEDRDVPIHNWAMEKPL
jgi:putative acetyltransferase